MKMNDQDRYKHVILSEAKNLPFRTEILRFTQNDMPVLPMLMVKFHHDARIKGWLLRAGVINAAATSLFSQI